MPGIARQPRPLAGLLLTGLVALTGCGGSNSGADGHSDTACAQRIKFATHALAAQPAVPVVKGSRVGQAAILGCSDGGENTRETLDAFSTPGLDVSLGVVVEDPMTGLTLFTLEQPTPGQEAKISAFLKTAR